MIAATHNSIAVATTSDSYVLVLVNIYDITPEIDYTNSDHIVECGIEVISKALVIHGPTDYIGDFHKIKIENGFYGVRIFYKNLMLSDKDSIDEKDYYTIDVLREDKFMDKNVLKQQEYVNIID